MPGKQQMLNKYYILERDLSNQLLAWGPWEPWEHGGEEETSQSKTCSKNKTHIHFARNWFLSPSADLINSSSQPSLQYLPRFHPQSTKGLSAPISGESIVLPLNQKKGDSLHFLPQGSSVVKFSIHLIGIMPAPGCCSSLGDKYNNSVIWLLNLQETRIAWVQHRHKDRHKVKSWSLEDREKSNLFKSRQHINRRA